MKVKKYDSGVKKEEWIIMDEKRRTKRLTDKNEVTITIVSERKNTPKEIIIHNLSEDISVAGTRINAHIYLPIDTLLMIEMTLKTVHQMIKVLGKVKWIKIIIEDKSYEAGVEFVNTPSEAIKRLGDYISWKQKIISLHPE